MGADRLVELLYSKDEDHRAQGEELCKVLPEEDLPEEVRGYLQRKRLVEWADEVYRQGTHLPLPEGLGYSDLRARPSGSQCPTLGVWWALIPFYADHLSLRMRSSTGGAFEASLWGREGDMVLLRLGLGKREKQGYLTLKWPPTTVMGNHE